MESNPLNPFDIFRESVTFYTTEVNEEAIRHLTEAPTKLIFNASRLEDVVFLIDGNGYTIDFPALVRDYGKVVEHG